MQPMQSVLRRWKDDERVLWAELECGHQTPCTSRPLATSFRCQDCPPVLVGVSARALLSLSCEKDRHGSCSRAAWDADRGVSTVCSCSCHRLRL